jgi:FkbM family methyltransferase
MSMARLHCIVLEIFFLSFILTESLLDPFYNGFSDKVGNGTLNANLICDMHSVHPRFVGSGKAFNICLRPNDLIGRVIKGRDGYWPECKHFYQFWHHHRPEGLFVDVGGNIGACSLLMAANQIPTMAFEPIPSNLFYFVESLRANKDFNITLYPLGASSVRKSATIFAEEGNWGNSMIGTPANPNKVHHNFTINLAPLDDVLWPDKNLPPPIIGLMKVDVQGFEGEVIRGAKALLKAGAVKFLASEMEPHTLLAHGMKASDYCNMLKGSGFQLIDGHGKPKDWAEYCGPYDLEANKDKIDNFWAKYQPILIPI